MSAAMTYFGVPILDWVLLVVLIGLGIEAYITTRSPNDKDAKPSASEKSRESKSEVASS
jgi:hypothetical protein